MQALSGEDRTIDAASSSNSGVGAGANGIPLLSRISCRNLKGPWASINVTLGVDALTWENLAILI